MVLIIALASDMDIGGSTDSRETPTPLALDLHKILSYHDHAVLFMS